MNGNLIGKTTGLNWNDRKVPIWVEPEEQKQLRDRKTHPRQSDQEIFKQLLDDTETKKFAWLRRKKWSNIFTAMLVH